jgi:hypothetical protein
MLKLFAAVPIFAQIEQAEAAVSKAAEHGWEAMLIAVVLIASIGGMGFIARWAIKIYTDRTKIDAEETAKREARLSERITSLEGFIRDKLLESLNKATEALRASADAQKDMAGVLKEHTNITGQLNTVVQRLAESLEERPCFWSVEKQAELLRRASEVVRQNHA